MTVIGDYENPPGDPAVNSYCAVLSGNHVASAFQAQETYFLVPLGSSGARLNFDQQTVGNVRASKICITSGLEHRSPP